MPVARYFLWVGAVLLSLLFLADACLPKLPLREVADTPMPAIHIHSEQRWPERIVFDTSAQMPHVTAAADAVQVDPVQQAVVAIPDRAREALAQLQTTDVAKMTAGDPKKQEVRRQRQQKIARRRVARPVLRATRQSEYAWFGGRMWW